MNLYDARSYFSAHFEDSLADPAELGRQLYEHRMESSTITDAIVELARFAQNRARFRKMSPAAKTLAGETIFELVNALAGESGRVSYGELALALRQRHRRAGNRSFRVFDKLEAAGALIVEHERNALGSIIPGGLVTVRLADELRKPPVEHVATSPVADDDPTDSPAFREALASADLTPPAAAGWLGFDKAGEVCAEYPSAATAESALRRREVEYIAPAKQPGSRRVETDGIHTWDADTGELVRGRS